MKEILKNKVHEARAGKGATQEEVAQAIGVTRQTIIAIERGNYAPSVALALKLAQYFKTSVENLFTL